MLLVSSVVIEFRRRLETVIGYFISRINVHIFRVVGMLQRVRSILVSVGSGRIKGNMWPHDPLLNAHTFTPTFSSRDLLISSLM